MKKNKLLDSYAIDFDLIGMVCPKKEYKLAWNLNQSLGISLVKQDDVRIEFADSTAILISNYKYESEYLFFELLQNKLVSGGSLKQTYLMPELKQFDFLLKFRDFTEHQTPENVSDRIKGIPIVEYTMRLNFDSLKSKENLLF